MEVHHNQAETFRDMEKQRKMTKFVTQRKYSNQQEKKRLNTIEPLGNLMEMKRNSWIMGQETLKRNPSFMTHSVLWIFHKCPRGAYGQAGKMGITHTHT